MRKEGGGVKKREEGGGVKKREEGGGMMDGGGGRRLA